MTAHTVFPKIRHNEMTSNRPFWSIMIPTLNGATFLEETLNSVLSQALSPAEMQVEVLDDGSDDETEKIVRQIGKGRILFNRNVHKLGLVGNWNACLERAQGGWVHILHQDDVVQEGFYDKLRAAIEANNNVGAAFCRHSFIDENSHCLSLAGIERETTGILDNWLERIAIIQLIQFPSIVVKRSVYEHLGGFCAAAHYAADWEMWKRIASCFPVCYVPDVLASYRLHSSSETSRNIHNGKNMSDIRTSIEISKAYLPGQSVAKWSFLASEHYALQALNMAEQMFINGQMRNGMIQVNEAFKTSRSVKVLRKIASIIMHVIKEVL